MRSLLVQASSVEKAVDKAWINAGMPTEFSIKILDFGEKGFLGMTKKYSIVSIFYEPQKQTSLSQKQQQRPPRQKQQAPARRERTQRHDTRDQKQQAPRPKPKPKPRQGAQDRQQERTNQTRPQARPQEKPQERIFWPEPLVESVTKWLKELTTKLSITTTFKAKTNRKALTITFDENVLEAQDAERLLFSSFSYLLMQFLKKEHKKKFQGYQLIITSQRFNK